MTPEITYAHPWALIGLALLPLWVSIPLSVLLGWVG